MEQRPISAAEIAQGTALLRRHRIWEAVPEKQLRQQIAQAELIRYAKGEGIWCGEDYRRGLGLVLEGAAQVKKERMLLSVHRSGDYFGLATLYAPEDYYAAEIEALCPSRILFLAQEQVDALLRSYPEAAMQLIGYLSERVYYLSARLDSVTAGSASRRLECHLRSIAEMDPSGRLFCPVSSRTALAKSLGMGRASLYRALDDLTRQGSIAPEGGGIVLLK